jgi:hypothetical protein
MKRSVTDQRDRHWIVTRYALVSGTRSLRTTVHQERRRVSVMRELLQRALRSRNHTKSLRAHTRIRSSRAAPGRFVPHKA